MFLGGPKNDVNFKSAVNEVEKDLASADSWDQVLKNASSIFEKKKGFHQVPH